MADWLTIPDDELDREVEPDPTEEEIALQEWLDEFDELIHQTEEDLDVPPDPMSVWDR